MKLDINQRAFFDLVQAGLWEQDVRLSPYNSVNFREVYNLAEEQSVVGLVAAGLEHVKGAKVPKDVVLMFVGYALQLEQQNTAQNQFVAELIDQLRRCGVYALLLKGQGIAHCYERPLWRACGDIDLLLSEKNYINAKKLLVPLASKVDEENEYNQHIAMTIDSWPVELHGSLKGGLWENAERVLDEVQYAVFCGGKVRSWANDHTQIFLPHADEDAVYVFYHILQHFFFEGIGLRQICDWSRLLWKNKDNIDVRQLEFRLKRMGIMSEWKSFAYLAVGYLGMPQGAVPFYSPERKWASKADRIMCFIFETGNFGHNRDYSYYQKHSFLVYKAISLKRHIKDTIKYFRIFPLDSLKVLWRKIVVGIHVALEK